MILCGEHTQIDEYEPTSTPTIRGSMNCLIETETMMNIGIITRSVVADVIIDLPSV